MLTPLKIYNYALYDYKVYHFYNDARREVRILHYIYNDSYSNTLYKKH